MAMSLEYSWLTGKWPLLEWNEDDGCWIGEWQVENTQTHLLIRVSNASMEEHVRGWQATGGHFKPEELRRVSAWLTTYDLWRQEGKTMPGVTVTQLSE